MTAALNEQMRRGFDVVLAEYQRSGGTPSRMNLTDVKSKLGEEFDIYVINESGVIEFTTFEPDMGLDFKKIPYFFAYLTKIRNSEGFFPDRIVEGQTVGGKINKFAYMPTPDHRYVFELGLSKTSFLNDRASSSTNRLLTKSPQPIHISKMSVSSTQWEKFHTIRQKL